MSFPPYSPRHRLENTWSWRILAVCGLRPAEILVLRIEDFEGTQLRIDEALKERQKGEDRIGETKTAESDNYVPVPPDLAREIATWIAGHQDRSNPRAFLFPNSEGGAFGVGNYLKRHLKPLAEKAGIHDLTFQAFRRSSSTHIQSHATVKDMQRHLRHTNPQTTLKHYAKVIPESLRAARRRPRRPDHRHPDQIQVTLPNIQPQFAQRCAVSSASSERHSAARELLEANADGRPNLFARGVFVSDSATP